MQRSQASLATLSREPGINPKTVAKWRKRAGPLGQRRYHWPASLERYLDNHDDLRMMDASAADVQLENLAELRQSYVANSRDKAAALTFMKKALKRQGSQEAITTDGLRSYRAAVNELDNAEKQEVGRWANNRVENSHIPFRPRERAISGSGR